MNTQDIEAREKAATEGPWENVRPGGVPPGIICDIGGESWDITDDADFMAHAREDIPYLLAELKEAREERDVAQETVVALSSIAQERDEAREKLERRTRLLRTLLPLCDCGDVEHCVSCEFSILKGGD